MGVHAMHPGTAPGDWVKPGGMPEMGYRSGMEGMMENSDVVKKKELKKFKVSREYDLRERSINMTNHCWTHKCSAYCLRKKKKKVKFDPKKHADMIGNVVCDKNEICCYCRLMPAWSSLSRALHDKQPEQYPIFRLTISAGMRKVKVKV